MKEDQERRNSLGNACEMRCPVVLIGQDSSGRWNIEIQSVSPGSTWDEREHLSPGDG